MGRKEGCFDALGPLCTPARFAISYHSCFGSRRQSVPGRHSQTSQSLPVRCCHSPQAQGRHRLQKFLTDHKDPQSWGFTSSFCYCRSCAPVIRPKDRWQRAAVYLEFQGASVHISKANFSPMCLGSFPPSILFEDAHRRSCGSCGYEEDRNKGILVPLLEMPKHVSGVPLKNPSCISISGKKIPKQEEKTNCA